jgi:hypothetical protein
MAKAEGIVSFQTAGMALALCPRRELAKHANVAADGQGLSGISLAYNTGNREEVDSVVSEARAADAAILKTARQAFQGGYSGYFSEPCEFLWEVAWNPGFRHSGGWKHSTFRLTNGSGCRANKTDPRQQVDLFLAPEKGKPGLNELSLGVQEDRSVAAMGHDPERRTGYGAIHFHCPSQLDRESHGRRRR